MVQLPPSDMQTERSGGFQFHRWNSVYLCKVFNYIRGIQGPFYQTIGSHSQYGSTEGAIFSPDGSKLHIVNIEMEVDLFDFDRCTGELSNLVHFHAPQPTLCNPCGILPKQSFLICQYG